MEVYAGRGDPREGRSVMDRCRGGWIGPDYWPSTARSNAGRSSRRRLPRRTRLLSLLRHRPRHAPEVLQRGPNTVPHRVRSILDHDGGG